MKRFLNTFYVLSEDIYMSLEGENVVAMRDKQEVARYPLHTLQGIVSFSYAGASPALMGACAKRGVGFALCTPNGRFLARVSGEISGNVLLRRTQYRTADDMHASCKIARTHMPDEYIPVNDLIEDTKTIADAIIALAGAEA